MTKKVLTFSASSSMKTSNKTLPWYAATLLEDATVEVLDLNGFEMAVDSADNEAKDGAPDGIRHIGLLPIDGVVDSLTAGEKVDKPNDDAFVSPEGFEDAAWFLTQQERRAWTFQMESRPAVEDW